MPSVPPRTHESHGSAPCRGTGEDRHRVRVVGNVRRGAETRLDCDRPLRVMCRDCSHTEYWRCDTYGCADCGDSKRRRLSRLVETGADQHLATGLHAYFLTLTAPGDREHKRWFQGKRPASRPACECHDHGMTLGMWNRQESSCWNRLRTAIARDRSLIYCGAVEVQDRGALHRHVVVFTDSPLSHQHVQEWALAAGYGCVLDLQALSSPKQVSRYLAKYVTKSSVDRSQVAWHVVDPETGEVVRKHASYRLWSSSRSWGVTMSHLRSVARAQARARARNLRELEEALREHRETLAVAAGLAPEASPDPLPG